jgi:hypothetical protein
MRIESIDKDSYIERIYVRFSVNMIFKLEKRKGDGLI